MSAAIHRPPAVVPGGAPTTAPGFASGTLSGSGHRGPL